jgi:hypothetical protein
VLLAESAELSSMREVLGSLLSPFAWLRPTVLRLAESHSLHDVEAPEIAKAFEVLMAVPEGVPPESAPPVACINQPGAWDFMISYTQRSQLSESLAYKIHGELVKRGLAVWLDVEMPKRDEAAMQEGVQNAGCVIAIVSGPAGDESAYFRRPFCLSELRWAKAAKIPVVPVVAAEDKSNITEFFEDIPADLAHMKGVNWEHIDRKDVDYFKLGIEKIIRAAADQANEQAEPEPEPELDPDL